LAILLDWDGPITRRLPAQNTVEHGVGFEPTITVFERPLCDVTSLQRSQVT
jgi:hypothetical protein